MHSTTPSAGKTSLLLAGFCFPSSHGKCPRPGQNAVWMTEKLSSESGWECHTSLTVFHWSFTWNQNLQQIESSSILHATFGRNTVKWSTNLAIFTLKQFFFLAYFSCNMREVHRSKRRIWCFLGKVKVILWVLVKLLKWYSDQIYPCLVLDAISSKLTLPRSRNPLSYPVSL